MYPTLVRWSFNGLHVPMMEAPDGILYTNNYTLARALATTENALRNLRKNHADEFSTLSIISNDANDFLNSNRVEFGIKRLKKDLIFWNEDDMILLAVLCKSPVGKQFRKDLVGFVKNNAVKDYVDQLRRLESKYDSLAATMNERFEALEESASSAGKTLANQKKLKGLRLVGEKE